MEEPRFTCPDKEKVEKILEEFRDCSVVNLEIDSLADKLKKEYAAQYDYYVNEILDRLDDYRSSAEKLRDYCNYQKKIISDLEKEIKELEDKINGN